MSRGRFIKLRVSDAELADIRTRATEAGMTLSDFMRIRTGNYRVRQTRADKERLRHLARIGSNINQVARWANTYKAAGPMLEVLLWLKRIEIQIMDIVHVGADDGGNSHAD